MDKKKIKVSNLLCANKIMEDDPLEWLIDNVNFNLGNHINYVNTMRFLIVLFLQVFNVIGIIFICKDQTGSSFRQYISLILSQQIGIASHVLQIFYTKQVLHLPSLAKSYFLPLNASGEKTYQTILRQCNLIRRLYPLIVIYPVTIYLTLIPLAHDRENIDFTNKFIKTYVGKSCIIFQWLYYFCIIHLGYSVSCIISICAYISFHLKFQILLLTEYIKQISCDYKPDIENAVYQEVVHKRLVSFVQVHAKLKIMSVNFLEVGQWSLIVILTSGTLAFTGLVYFIIADVSPKNNIHFTYALVGAMILAFFFTGIGQLLRDKSNDLYNAACQCQWVYWNIQNRKTLLMILINSSKELSVNSFGILNLGHQTLLQLTKLTYNMVLLLINFNK